LRREAEGRGGWVYKRLRLELVNDLQGGPETGLSEGMKKQKGRDEDMQITASTNYDQRGCLKGQAGSRDRGSTVMRFDRGPRLMVTKAYEAENL